MTKILLSILLVLIWVSPIYGETCTFDNAGGGGDGAWHTATNWSCDVSGEKVPAANDAVVLSAAAAWVPASGERIPATSGALGTITSTGAYGITIDVDSGNTTCDVSGTCAIYFTTATANTETLFNVTGTSTTAYITFSGTSITASAGTSNKHGILHGGGNLLIIDAALIGSSGSSGDGLYMTGSGTATVSKSITGGGANGAHGASNGGGTNAVLTVTGGTVTGGSVLGAFGINNSSVDLDNVVISAGVKLENTTTSPAISGSFTWNAGADDYWTIGSTKFAKEVAAADLKKDVKNGSVTGTLEAGGGGAWAY